MDKTDKPAELADRLEALHNAAKGREFDLTPADGPIAQLTLFMHENAAAVIAALSQPPSDAALQAENERLREALEASKVTIERGNYESGYCCCGDPIESHSIGSGHSPVDAEQYAAHQTVEMINAALTQGKPDSNLQKTQFAPDHT